MMELHLPDVDSLKGKRHVLKGLKERVRARFEVSVAEVAHQDTWQRATLALAYVSSDARHATEVVSKAMDFIEDHIQGMVLDTTVEILSRRASASTASTRESRQKPRCARRA